MTASNEGKGASSRVLLRTLQGVGSIRFGLVIMTVLAIAMGWATFLEREMGTPSAQYLVYASTWFYGLVGLLALNIIFSALIRLPAFFRSSSSRRALTPFFIAHIGVVALILGCWITAEKSSRARVTIPEGTAAETAIDADSRLLHVTIDDWASGAERIEDSTPFSGGPLNWRDQESSALWRANVSDPILAQMPETNAFKKFAKKAAGWSQKVAYWAARAARLGKSSALYDRNGVKIDVLEYATLADYAPVDDFKLELLTRDADGNLKSNGAKIDFPFDQGAIGGDPLGVSRRARRVQAADGTRLVYVVADSSVEANAFAKLSARDDSEPSDILSLVLDGERYDVSLEALGVLSRYGDVEAQAQALTAQKEAVEARLKAERDRDDLTETATAETLPPLQLTSIEKLDEESRELAELNQKLVDAADAATDPTGRELEADANFQALAQELSLKRAKSYVSQTFARLEQTMKTSAEFCSALETTLADTTKRVAEIEETAKKTALGNSGWKIVGAEITPTLFQGVDELQGWTAQVALATPQGDRDEIAIFSEYPERNRGSRTGRVYGALRISQPGGDDNEYGRPWNPNLGKPKLTFLQTRDERVLYLYEDGGARQTGELQLSAVDVERGVFAANPVQWDAEGALAGFVVNQLVFQDELGARVLPTLFQKDMANEFYGKLKLRVSFDNLTETFWLRSIPLESVSEAQRKSMVKTLTSNSRRVEISLADKEIDLGVALYVKNFTPTYEPGSSTPASFASVVRILPAGLSPEEQAEMIAKDPEKDVVIRMNRPGAFSPPGAKKVYWAYQDSFRGPFRPGDSEFDRVVQGKLLPGETQPRDVLYHTIISLNDDPGRGLKYLACLFIVWGAALLAYRGGKSRRAASPESPESPEAPESSDGSTAQSAESASSDAAKGNAKGKTSGTVASALVLLAAFFGAVGTTIAQEAPSETEKAWSREARAQESAKSIVALRSIDWSAWRRIPVFYDGRRQPLNTFAEIVVRDVVGDSQPSIRVSDQLLDRLDSDVAINFPTLSEFLAEFETESSASPEDAQRVEKERREWYATVEEKTLERQRAARERLLLRTDGGSIDFTAAELLFSWFAETECWVYLPFLDDPKDLVAKEVLRLSDLDVKERGGRLSPIDLEAIVPGQSKTFVEAYRGSAEAKPEVLKALDRIEDRLATFESLTYAPTRGASSRVASYFNRILYGTEMNMGMFHPTSEGPMTKLATSSQKLETLLTRETRTLRKTSPFYDKEFLLRRRTPISGDGKGRETLEFARQVALLGGLARKTPVSTLDLLFEKLQKTTDETLATLKTHRDEIVSKGTFSTEYRVELMKAISAFEEIANDLDCARIAMTNESGKALYLCPMRRAPQSRAGTGVGVESPWASLQSILWLSDFGFARYLDPAQSPQNADDDALLDGARGAKLDPFADPFQALADARSSRGERGVADAFCDAVWAYRRCVVANFAVEEGAEDVGVAAPERARRVSAALETFETNLRSLAERVDSDRRETTAEETFAKTSYPKEGALDLELFYYRFNAFFWNWIFGLAALAAFAYSYGLETTTGKRSIRYQTIVMIVSLGAAIACCVGVLFSSLTTGGAFGVIVGSALGILVLAPPSFMKKQSRSRGEFVIGAILLACSCVVAFIGGATRAAITGWAPVSNMFETVVLLAFLIALIALCYATSPLWSRSFRKAWRTAAFFYRGENSRERLVSRVLFAPRLALTLGLGYWALDLWTSAGSAGGSFFENVKSTFANALAMQGILDAATATATFLFFVWSAPRVVLTFVALVLCPRTFWRLESSSAVEGASWSSSLDEVFQRKTFLVSSALIGTLVAACAYFNSAEFNPHIRPLVAVLRSNFWLTIHVLAIIVSYALGAIAWAASFVSLGSYAFGRYNASGEFEPRNAVRFAPFILTTTRSSVVFLTLGIILGARWADFSWGRFWSWDPKEVWALATLLVYLVVLHAYKLSGGKKFALSIGAAVGALAIIMTWYGLSFVMGGGGRHTYAAGESNKVVVLYALFAANLGWAALGAARYYFERIRRRRLESRGE